MKPNPMRKSKHYQPTSSKISNPSTSNRSKKPSYDQSANPMSSFDPFPNTLFTKASATSNAPPFHLPSHHHHNSKSSQQGIQYSKTSSASTAQLERGGNFQKSSTNKKKRQVIKKDQISTIGNTNPIISHKRNISANVPYQAITNHTLSNLNRPSPSIGSTKSANYLNSGGASAISARSIKVISSSKPQLLVTSQLSYVGNQGKNTYSSNKPQKSKLPSTLSLVQMLQSDSIQSARSAFVKPASSQPTSTRNIKQANKVEFYQIDNSSSKTLLSARDSNNNNINQQSKKSNNNNYAFSTTNLRKGGVADNNICSTMQVPMPSKARQSVPDMIYGDQEQKTITSSNNLQLKKQQILKNANQMRSRTNLNSQSTATSNSSYDQRHQTIGMTYSSKGTKDQRGPLLPLNSNIKFTQKKQANKGDQIDFELECGEEIKNIEQQDSQEEEDDQQQQAEQTLPKNIHAAQQQKYSTKTKKGGHQSLHSDDGRLSIPSQKSRTYVVPPTNVPLAFKINQLEPPLLRKSDYDQGAKQQDQDQDYDDQVFQQIEAKQPQQQQKNKYDHLDQQKNIQNNKMINKSNNLKKSGIIATQIEQKFTTQETSCIFNEGELFLPTPLINTNEKEMYSHNQRGAKILLLPQQKSISSHVVAQKNQISGSGNTIKKNLPQKTISPPSYSSSSSSIQSDNMSNQENIQPQQHLMYTPPKCSMNNNNNNEVANYGNNVRVGGDEQLNSNNKTPAAAAGVYKNQFSDYQFVNQWILREAVYHPDPFYLQRQTQIDNSMRSILIDWMIEVNSQFNQKRQTLASSVNIVDRYLSLTSDVVQKSQFQLIGCTAMFIAAKMEEVFVPKIDDYVMSTENGYTGQQIRRNEEKMLKCLGWLLSPMTYVQWANYYSEQWDIYLNFNRYSFNHPALGEMENKRFLIQMHIANHNSYQIYRYFMQVLDVVQMDVHSMQYNVRATVASVLYLVLGESLKFFTQMNIVEHFQNSSSFLQSQQLVWWNDLFENYLVTAFGFELRQLLPTIQYVAAFFKMRMDFSVPQMNDKQQNMTLNSSNPEQQKAKIQIQTQQNHSLLSSSNHTPHQSDLNRQEITSSTSTHINQSQYKSSSPSSSPHHHHQVTNSQKSVMHIEKTQSQREKRLSKLQADALKGNEVPLEKRRSKLPAKSDKSQSEATVSKKVVHSSSSSNNSSSRESIRSGSNLSVKKETTLYGSKNGINFGQTIHEGRNVNSKPLTFQNRAQFINKSEKDDELYTNKSNLLIRHLSHQQIKEDEEQYIQTNKQSANLRTPEKQTKTFNKLKPSGSNHNSPFLVSRDPTSRRQKFDQNNSNNNIHSHQRGQRQSYYQLQSFLVAMKVADQILQQLVPSSSPYLTSHLTQQIGLPKCQMNNNSSNSSNNSGSNLLRSQVNQPLFFRKQNGCSKNQQQQQQHSPQVMMMMMGEPQEPINQQSHQKGQQQQQQYIKKSKREYMTPSRTPQPKSRTLLNSASISTDFATPLTGCNGKLFNSGRWKKDEHKRFLQALKKHGRQWKQVQLHVATRSSTQARSHAQKFLSKLEKKNIKLEDYLQNWDPENSDDHFMSDDQKVDNKCVHNSGGILNPQERKRMSKEEMVERREFQNNLMLRNQYTPKLLKQRSSPLVQTKQSFMSNRGQSDDDDDDQYRDDEEVQNKQQNHHQFQRSPASKNSSSCFKPKQSSALLQPSKGGKKRLSPQAKSSKQLGGGKENTRVVRESISPPLTRRKSAVSNQTEDDRRSINSLFQSKNVDLQRRKSCKVPYQSNQQVEYESFSPQVTSKKSRGQKHKYHKIRISNIQQPPQQNQYAMYQQNQQSFYESSNQYQQQYDQQFQQPPINGSNILNHSNYPQEYQMNRYEEFIPLTPQPVNKSLLNHRKNFIPLNNNNSSSNYQHISTPPPPGPPHFQNLILPPSSTSVHEQLPPSSAYHRIAPPPGYNDMSWMEMHSKNNPNNSQEYVSNNFDSKSQNLEQDSSSVSAIPAINTNIHYSIPPPPPQYSYFLEPLNSRNQQYQGRSRGNIINNDLGQNNNDEDENEQEQSEDQEEQGEEQQQNQEQQHQQDQQRSENSHHNHHHLRHHQVQQHQYSENNIHLHQYAQRYRQDLGILRSNYPIQQQQQQHTRNYQPPHDMGQYYSIQAQNNLDYMNFQLNNPYHHHHLQQQQQQNHLIESSQSSILHPEYMMGLNNSNNNSQRMIQNSSLGADDSYPIQQQYNRDRALSFPELPQNFKIPVNMSPDQRNNIDEEEEDEGDDATSQQYMMMMGQEESIGASNPYRNAYQGCTNNLLEQYKYMEDEIVVREH